MQDRQENCWILGRKETWPPTSNSPNNDAQTKSTTMCHKQGISTKKNELMNCEFENSFLLVYLSGPLIITRGPRGAAPADPPLSGHECLSCHAKSLCDYNSELDFLR